MRDTQRRLMCILLLFSNLAQATETVNPNFSAECEESSARGYWYATDFKGELSERNGWTNSGFASKEPWVVRYLGGDVVEIDGKSTPIIAQHRGVIVALTHSGDWGMGSSAFLYVIHIGLKRLVVTEAGGYGYLDKKLSGINGSVIEFNCKFDI